MDFRPSWQLPAGSLDHWPDDYERGRPGWPPEVVEVAGLPPSATVLDVGAGTGKLTRLLESRFERVVAVEPAESMLRRLVRSSPHANGIAGSGQHLPLRDASVDAVFAAQSFHWFDDEQSIGQLVRVLRPAGALVLMWNLPAGATEPSIHAVEDLLSRHAPTGDMGYDPLDLGHGPGYATAEWRAAFERWGFEPMRESRLTHVQTLDREGVVAYYASMGWVADLPDAERLPLLDEVRTKLAEDEYRRPWHAHVRRTRRRSPA